MPALPCPTKGHDNSGTEPVQQACTDSAEEVRQPYDGKKPKQAGNTNKQSPRSIMLHHGKSIEKALTVNLFFTIEGGGIF